MTHPGFTWFQAWQSLCRTEAKIPGASCWLPRPCPSPGLRPPSPPLGERDGVRGWFMVSMRAQSERRLPMNKRTSNIEHPTPNFDGSANPRSLRRSMFGVRRSMFSLGSGVSTRECSFRGNLSRNRERVAGDRVMVPEQFQKEQEAPDEPARADARPPHMQTVPLPLPACS